MFGSGVLDVAIGLVFLYLLLSLFCSAVQEAIASFFRLRAQNLQAALKNMLGDEQARQLLSHGLIRSLGKPGPDGLVRPSYIPARRFADTMISLMVSGEAAATSGEGSPAGKVAMRATAAQSSASSMTAAVDQLPPGPTKDALTAILAGVEADLEAIRVRLESWFNDVMDRASGWYKRRTQLVLALIAAVVVIAMNADTIAVVRALSLDPELRRQIADNATQYVQVHADDCESGEAADLQEAISGVNEALSDIQDSRLPIGWSWAALELETHNPADALTSEQWCTAIKAVGYKLPGFLLTVFAVSLGAPFWFDLLNKLANLRSTGRPPAPEPVAKKPETTPAKAGG